MSQAKHWMFTINNPTEEYDYLIRALPYKYCIYSYEMATSGTVHIQGYVSFQTAKKLAFMKKHLPTGHFDIRRGSHSQAKAYCSKTEDVTFLDGPYEMGDDSDIADKSGSRRDLLNLKEDIDSGMTYDQIGEKHFSSWLKYERGIRSYRNLKTKDRVYQEGEKPKIVIYWGPSGTGKSSRVMKEYPNAYWLTKPQVQTAEVLWQDYEGQEVVVFDEFYSWIQYDKLLRICDYYPEKVRMLYGSAKLQAKTFVFTSNQNPDLWYDKVKDKSAWNRRLQEFGHIEFMGEKYNFGIDQTESTDTGYISEEL